VLPCAPMLLGACWDPGTLQPGPVCGKAGADGPAACAAPRPGSRQGPDIPPARGGARRGPARSPGKGPGHRQAGQPVRWPWGAGGHGVGRPHSPAGRRAPRLAEPRGQEGATQQRQPPAQPQGQARRASEAGRGCAK